MRIKKHFVLLSFITFCFTTNAQIKGIVKDSLTGEPIPYVALVNENTTIGTNSNEKGEFEFSNNIQNTKTFISILGYQTKTIVLKEFNEILLVRKTNEIQEIIITNKKNTSEIVIDEYKNPKMGFANGGASQIWAKHIKLTKEIKTHSFIKSIQFTTKSKVKNAKLKLRFFYTDNEGKPSDDVIFDDIIVTVKKGTNSNIVLLEEYNIQIPENGIFIGFENLIIEENKYEYTYTNEGQKGVLKGIRYEPVIKAYEAEEYNVWSIKNNISFLFNHKFKENSKPLEIGIKITLTN